MPDRNRPRMKRRRNDWINSPVGRGCALCGHMKPGLPSHGLTEAHIIKDRTETENSMFLCKNCADSFDLILKPAIYRALMNLNDGKVPDNWEDAEGRQEKLPEV